MKRYNTNKNKLEMSGLLPLSTLHRFFPKCVCFNQEVFAKIQELCYENWIKRKFPSIQKTITPLGQGISLLCLDG